MGGELKVYPVAQRNQVPHTQGGGRVFKGPKSHIICLKLIDLCRTNTKRELSPVEV